MKLRPKVYAKILYEVTKEKNHDEIKKILDGFVALLARNNDLKKSDDIMDHYHEIHNRENSIVEVELKAARQLSDESLKKIEKYVSELTGRNKVVINFGIDKKVIGGFILKYGSTILDASLKARVESLRNKMVK